MDEMILDDMIDALEDLDDEELEDLRAAVAEEIRGRDSGVEELEDEDEDEEDFLP